MSGTEYAKRFTLRLDNQDRADLTRALMNEIERVQSPPHLGAPVDRPRLRRLRSMLDRLTD